MEPDKKLLYYFAHPYTGDEQNNFILANHRSVELLNRGFYIFSPITHSHPLQNIKIFDGKVWEELDRFFIDFCDGLIVAPSWQYSGGCVKEHSAFTLAGKPIYNYEDLVK